MLKYHTIAVNLKEFAPIVITPDLDVTTSLGKRLPLFHRLKQWWVNLPLKNNPENLMVTLPLSNVVYYHHHYPNVPRHHIVNKQTRFINVGVDGKLSLDKDNVTVRVSGFKAWSVKYK